MATSANYLVLGAAGGIGTELCQQLVSAGHRVMMCGRNGEKLQNLAQQLGQPSLTVEASDWEAVGQAVETAIEQFGRLDGAVNLVGSLLLKPSHLTSRADWDATVSQNLTSAFGLLRAVAPQLQKNEQGGSIVLMSSAAAQIGLPNHEAIAAAKGGIIGMARAAAATYAASGVRVNAVAPGLTQTPMTERVWKNDKAAATSRSMHPLGRLGEPADIASAIAWLLAPEQTWVTGQVLGVDGGLGGLKTMRN